LISYNFETGQLICNTNIKQVEQFIKGFKMTWETFKLRITFWGTERQLYKEVSVRTQIDQLVEEVGEVKKAYEEETVGNLMVEIGDVYTVLHNLCHMLGVEPEECMELTWGKIKDCNGEFIDGNYVREKVN